MARRKHRKLPVTLDRLKVLLGKIKGTRKGCWRWTASLYASGYGVSRLHGRQMSAHRVFYEIFKGEIPEGCVVDHLCRNKACVNPHHLEAVTQSENIRRCVPRGKRHWNGKKTHCKNGHPFSGRNLRVHYKPDGRPQRICRTCSMLANRRRRAKARELAREAVRPAALQGGRRTAK